MFKKAGMLLLALAALAWVIHAITSNREENRRRLAAEQIAMSEQADPAELAEWRERVRAAMLSKVEVEGPLAKIGPDVIGTIFYVPPLGLRVSCNAMLESVDIGFDEGSTIQITSRYAYGEGPTHTHHPESPAAQQMHDTACSAAKETLARILLEVAR